ncbi:hypothetical protein MLD38_003093 [Melastoma candidum]|uniref:Uncharacterized protein n=1 Tax=Melastoma candidum TaxID=119954 RepID=A0ACB9S0Y8_9MYRT|nr:hypothetical protein MLD38_003093 [Melastoma candidum]
MADTSSIWLEFSSFSNPWEMTRTQVKDFERSRFIPARFGNTIRRRPKVLEWFRAEGPPVDKRQSRKTRNEPKAATTNMGIIRHQGHLLQNSRIRNQCYQRRAPGTPKAVKRAGRGRSALEVPERAPLQRRRKASALPWVLGRA